MQMMMLYDSDDIHIFSALLISEHRRSQDFRCEGALFYLKKVITFFSHPPQSTGYPPKLTTRIIPRPIIIFFLILLLTLLGFALTTYPSKLNAKKIKFSHWGAPPGYQFLAQ